MELRGESTSLRQLVREVWASRHMMAMLARKDFFVRFRRSSFGILWAVGLPLIQAIVLAVVFTRVIRIQTGTSYPVFIYSGLVGWTYFNTTLTTASTAIVDGADLTNRIYFPRAILPLVVVGANLYAFVVTPFLVIGMALILGVGLDWHLVLFVPATLLMVALTTAFALLTSALHVYFRDVRYIVQAAMSVWFWVTPLIYPLKRLHGHPVLEKLVELNPVTGVVEVFRAAVVGPDPSWPTPVVACLVWIALLGTIAALMHRRYNRVFPDLL